MVVILSRPSVLSLLVWVLAAIQTEAASLISEECSTHQLKRMLQCARDYKEIVDHVSFKCREIGKQGPCQDGEILVLNKESDVSCKSERPSHPQNSTLIIQCFAPFCLSNGGCSEDEIFYDGDC